MLFLFATKNLTPKNMAKVTTIEIIGETNQKPTKKKAHAEMRRMSLLLNSNRYCWI